MTDHTLRTAEFDAFGPWIYEVRTPEDVPRLFRSQPVDLGSALLVLKVPRNIARRDADPTMDLYDHLLVATETGLTVLTRVDSGADSGVDSGVAVRTIAWGDVLAVSTCVDLVDGLLTVLTSDGPVHVPFNGSSQETVLALVAIIRSRFVTRAGTQSGTRSPAQAPLGGTPAGPGAAETPAPELPAVERELQNTHHRLLNTERGFRHVATQSRTGVRSIHPQPWARYVWNLWPTSLQSALYYTDGHELLVVHRKSPVVRGFAPVHSIARTSIALDRVVAVAVEDSAELAPVRVLRLTLGADDGPEVALPFEASSPALEQLRTLLARESHDLPV